MNAFAPAALLFLISFLFAPPTHAQRVLLLEKINSSRSDRITVGEELRFRMLDDDFWQQGAIRELRPDIQAVVINDRFIMLSEIEAIHRGKTIFAAAGYGLMTFSLGWTGIGLVGYATDKNPETNFTRSDATIALASLGTGFLLNKFLGQRRVKIGKRHRLRIVDTSF